jgi:hypothetical protein
MNQCYVSSVGKDCIFSIRGAYWKLNETSFIRKISGQLLLKNRKKNSSSIERYQ